MADDVTPDSLLAKIARAPSVAPSGRRPIPPRYELHGVLGEGGFGIVYDVLDRERGERVALKMLHRVAAAAALRFKREFRTLVDLRHRNLVRLYELGGEGQDLYFTMERLEGARHFDAVVGGDVARLRSGLAQLASGVRALHAAGVLHRDLKPSNVVVTPSGRLVLVDFGLARGLDAGASTEVAGTPAYMAPEQCGGGVLGPAADLYAVGVMMFATLAGRLPFEGVVADVIAQKQTIDAPRLLSVAPDVPPDLAELTDALLRRDPSARPSAAELEERLVRDPERPRARRAEGDPWVARDEELGALTAIVRARRAAFVRIEGPSGIGKTALLDRLCRQLDGAWVLRGRCHPRERVPYKAFDEVIDRLASTLARAPGRRALLPDDAAAAAALFPVLEVIVAGLDRDPSAAANRRQGLAALREIFARLAREGPVLVAIEDIQWGDADSASLLVELLREPDPPPIAVVATRRDGDRGALLEHLETLVGSDVEIPTEVVRLGPLAAEDARALARALTGDAARADEIARASEGHPLLLTELAREDRGADLDALVRRRIDALPSDARDVLRLVVVAGHPLPDEVLARAAGVPPREILDALVLARLVQTSTRGVHPYHDRIGEIALRTISGADQRELHLRLAVALVELDGDAERIAAHFDEADDARAAEHTLMAARRAAGALAFRQAAALLERTLLLRRRQGLSRHEAMELELARANALGGAGRARAAAEAYLAAAELAPLPRARELRGRAVRHLLLGGHVERGFAVFRGVLDDVGVRFPRTPLEATARIAAESARGWVRKRLAPRPMTPERHARLETLWSAQIMLLNVAPLYGLAAMTIYRSEVEASDSAVHRFRAAALGAFQDVVRHGARARDASRAAIASAYAEVAAMRDPRLEIDRKLLEAYVEHFGLRFLECEALIEECIELSSRLGTAWSLEPATARALLSSVYFIRGDLPRARRYLPSLVVEANERDQRMVWVLAAYHQSWVRALQQGAEPMQRASEEIGARWHARGNELQDWWRRIADHGVALVAGDPATAYARVSLDLVDALKQRAFATRFHYLEGRCFLARAAIALAATDAPPRERLLRQADEIRRELRAEPSGWTLALSLGLEVGIASVRAPADVERVLDALAAASDDAGLVLLAALARLELAHRTRDPALRVAAERFFADSAIGDPVYAARLTLPGRLRIAGFT